MERSSKGYPACHGFDTLLQYLLGPFGPMFVPQTRTTARIEALLCLQRGCIPAYIILFPFLLADKLGYVSHFTTRRIGETAVEHSTARSQRVGDAGCSTPAFKKCEQVVQHCNTAKCDSTPR